MIQFAPAIGPSTAILPILNGMTHLDSPTARFGAQPVRGGLAQISATLDSEGRVVHFGGSELVFGEVAAAPAIVSVHYPPCSKGAGSPRASDEVLQDMWEKWVQLGLMPA